MGIGRKAKLLRLRKFAGDRVILKVAEMRSHQRVVIAVGADVERVEVTEIHKFFKKGHNCVGCNLNNQNHLIFQHLQNYELYYENYNFDFIISHFFIC